MNVSFEKLQAVVKKAKQAQENQRLYCISPEHIPVSIDDLHWVIQDSYKLTIEMTEVPFEGAFLRGLVERYEGNIAKIYIREDQSERDKRFATAKELAHLMIDEPEDWSPFGVKTIEDLIIEASIGTANEHAAREVESEVLAQLAAYELLYPHTYRHHDIEMIANGDATLKSLAVHYSVPEFVVGIVLNQRYMETLSKVWESI